MMRKNNNKNVINFYNKKININEKETVEENCAVGIDCFYFACSVRFLFIYFESFCC